MRLSRVFVDEPLASDSLAVLGGTAANHVLRVLRLRPGDELTVFDGRGGEFAARIEGLRKDAVRIEVGARRAIERESPLAITLAQGVSRGERMDLVVQKATELGVRRMIPIITERSVVRLDAKQADAKQRHWRAIAISACEQCGRNVLPEIAAPVELAAFLSSAGPGASAGSDASAGPDASVGPGGMSGPAAVSDASMLRIVLSPHGTLRVRDLPPAAALTVLIGPEGGLADAELESARRAGFQAMRLGPRILRTETAAIAGLAVVQQHLGDL